jgi:hypothetical protein
VTVDRLVIVLVTLYMWIRALAARSQSLPLEH